jgi:hypothetical protein
MPTLRLLFFASTAFAKWPALDPKSLSISTRERDFMWQAQRAGNPTTEYVVHSREIFDKVLTTSAVSIWQFGIQLVRQQLPVDSFGGS